MLVNVYAVRLNGQQSWHLAIHLEAAALFWLEQNPADSLDMAIIESAIPLGQAVRLLDELGKNRQDGGQAGNRHKIHERYDVKQQSASDLQILKPYFQGKKVHVQTHSRKDLVDRLQHSWRPNASVHNRLVEALDGRQLLLEEIESLIQHVMAGEEDGGRVTGGSRSVGRGAKGKVANESGRMGLQTGENVERDAVLNITFQEIKAYIQYAALCGDVALYNGLQTIERRQLPLWWRKQQEYACRRCGSGMAHMHITQCASCGGTCAYCEACLTMGRVRHCSLLVHGVRGSGGEGQNRGDQLREQVVGFEHSDIQTFIQPWGLSPAQAEAARSGLSWLKKQVGRDDIDANPSQFLIWAVTGAGKTEMIFPFIGYTLARGGKVLIATPRRDVVLELRPRVMRAFPGFAAVTLYGGSDQRWDSGPIVIATTHQLLRYREAFDLVIIDELDAFPYHGDPMLGFAARRACKPSGSTLLLSATPPAQLRRDTVRGKLPHVKVPARYHGYPLPVPRQLAVPALPQMCKADALPSALLAALRASLARGAQLFVFVPSIATVEPLVHLLRRTLLAAASSAGDSTSPPAPSPAPLVIDGTSSKDSGRTDKVQQFRDGHIRILVTTTILERGVTVPKTDVFILDANSRLFDEASLVQMAGRAGRSKDDPAGRVFFAAPERTKAQSSAIAQIKSMNRLAKQKGYLHGQELDRNPYG